MSDFETAPEEDVWQRVFHWEATTPPVRGSDRIHDREERAAVLARNLSESSWNSEIVRNGKVVTWTEKLPDDYDLTDFGHVAETARYVGAFCSDTLGPESRKAHLRYRLHDGSMSPSYTCEGAW